MKALIKIPSFFLALSFATLCFAPAPRAQAVSPAPDGGYAGGNTAEGTNALFSLTSGVWNTAIGQQSLYHVTAGRQNTATGYQTLFSNTTGSLSTAYGSQSLYNNTTGSFNTATGFRTLYANTEGSQNTAIGYEALALNATGQDNTAVGFLALYHNNSGLFPPGGFANTAVGSQALFSNTIGGSNTANGYEALYSNTTGFFNTAIGQTALAANTAGTHNTAIGFQALGTSTTGSNNTAIGSGALVGTEAGDGNTATGVFALRDSNGSNNNTADGFNALGHAGGGDDNTAIGANTLSQLGFPGSGGRGNTALGSGAGVGLLDGDNNIYIGNPGVDTESGTVRIGTAGTQTTTFVAGISGTAVSGTAVVVDGNGQLGVAASSARFKDEIRPMDKASEAILALKPVTFRYKPEIDPKRAHQFGLVAEDVEKVNPDLVVPDKDGKPYSVRYDQVNAMLLNEFLKEHRKVEQQDRKLKEEEATISELKQDLQATAARQQKQIEALSAVLQKVSAKLEVNNPGPQIVRYSQ